MPSPLVSAFRFERVVAHWVTVGTKYHPSMARKGSVLVLASAMLTLAACSSDGDATPATTPTTPATVATTTVASTTTSTAPTTQAPTTTIDPAVALAAEVEADFREADRLGREASMDPFDAEKEAAALERRLGVIAENLAARLAEWRDLNYALRENPDVPASITVETPATLVLEGGDVAEMQICEVDSWVIVEVGAGPNGSEAIVNDDVVASRATVFLRSVDGIWRYEGGNVIEEWEGETACGSAS
jgi:hypothetical protein